MDKNQFIRVLHHFSGSSVAEAEEVLALKKRYPYSQVLHALSAKVSKDHGFSNHQQELQLAAIYASDRSVLKEVMNTEYNRNEVSEAKDPDAKPPKKTPDVSVKPDASVKKIDVITTDQRITTVHSTVDSEDLADAVLADLEMLSKSRHDFESMFDGTTVISPPLEESIDQVTENTHDVIRSKGDEAVMQVHQQVEALASKQEKTGKSKKARIVELARALEAERIAAEKQEGTLDDGIASADKRTGDALIDEIASTKSAITPETEKQKKQIEIIDQFIKAQPSITSAKDKPVVTTGDFSTIKSGEFGDNIVSETLVDILVKQGKKDKAVEVLKKLIWKYPQKKAYFAAQIDELKK